MTTRIEALTAWELAVLEDALTRHRDNAALDEYRRARLKEKLANLAAPLRRKLKEEEYQPKTGQSCTCKPGIERDNCPACEGTGWRIDFAAIRKRLAEKHRQREGNNPFAWS